MEDAYYEQQNSNLNDNTQIWIVDTNELIMKIETILRNKEFNTETESYETKNEEHALLTKHGATTIKSVLITYLDKSHRFSNYTDYEISTTMLTLFPMIYLKLLPTIDEVGGEDNKLRSGIPDRATLKLITFMITDLVRSNLKAARHGLTLTNTKTQIIRREDKIHREGENIKKT